MLNAFEISGNTSLRYDWNLFLEAKGNIMSFKSFYYNSKFTIKEVQKNKFETINLLINCVKMRKSKHLIEKQSLICFHKYLTHYDLNVREWYITHVSKWGKRMIFLKMMLILFINLIKILLKLLFLILFYLLLIN